MSIDAVAASPDDDDLKKAEQRGYARGYAAGRKRVRADNLMERYHREQQAFLDKAFLAALPACVDAQGWKSGDQPITGLQQRVELAVKFANEALKQRRIL